MQRDLHYVFVSQTGSTLKCSMEIAVLYYGQGRWIAIGDIYLYASWERLGVIYRCLSALRIVHCAWIVCVDVTGLVNEESRCDSVGSHSRF